MAEILNFNDGKGPFAGENKPSEKHELAAYVWTCAKCGNSTFQLVQGGAIRCACCNLAASLMHFDPRVKP